MFLVHFGYTKRNVTDEEESRGSVIQNRIETKDIKLVKQLGDLSVLSHSVAHIWLKRPHHQIKYSKSEKPITISIEMSQLKWAKFQLIQLQLAH